MLNYEIEVWEIRGGIVHVVHIECISAERVDRRAFMDVNVFDSKFLGEFQILVGPRVI